MLHLISQSVTNKNQIYNQSPFAGAASSANFSFQRDASQAGQGRRPNLISPQASLNQDSQESLQTERPARHAEANNLDSVHQTSAQIGDLDIDEHHLNREMNSQKHPSSHHLKEGGPIDVAVRRSSNDAEVGASSRTIGDEQMSPQAAAVGTGSSPQRLLSPKEDEHGQ